MLNTYVENDIREIYMPKQTRATDFADIITINGEEYATIQKAQQILTELASELGHPRNYSRFAAFRLAVDHQVDIISTPSANYYSIKGLRSLKDKIQPQRGTHQDIKHYSQETREKAIVLHQQGISNRKIAQQLGVSYQTVNNWIRKVKQFSEESENS